MSQPKLTVGMAQHTDYYGAVTTIQQLRLSNKRMSEVEILVVDSSIGSNNPTTKAHSEDLKRFLASCNQGLAGCHYVEFEESQGFGTTQPRNRVFEKAQGEFVLCMDSHIMLEPYALDRLIDYHEKNPSSGNLIQGPILHDNLSVMADEFSDEWRDEMWGIWGNTRKGMANEETENLPPIIRQEKTSSLEPYEIWAMGLGLFGCRKDAWLEFNDKFRGFGGEEWYIHEKFRQAGNKCLCLPWLRWWHRFGRPGGIYYPISMELKVRNYILGHLELGRDLEPIKKHFVDSGKLSQQTWEWLVSDPENNIPTATVPQRVRRQGESQERPNQAIVSIDDRPRGNQPPKGSTLEETFEWCKNTPRDLNEHLDTLRHWASKCTHVTEFSERRESTVGFLLGRPKDYSDLRNEFTLVSYNTERDYLLSKNGALHSGLEEELQELVDNGKEVTFTQTVGHSLEVPIIEETDLLFIDTKHNGNRLSEELNKHGSKVRRAIVVHDTAGWLPMQASQGWGERGDDGGPGLNQAMRDWIEQNPEWFVAFFDPKQYGLTILSKYPEDCPQDIVHAWPPGYGPGSELKAILASVDINPSAGCDCNRKAMQMDLWGVKGCEERFDEIVGWMREGKDRWGWTDNDKWKAASKMVFKDPMLAVSLNPKDPFPGLIRASIKRARKVEENLSHPCFSR